MEPMEAILLGALGAFGIGVCWLLDWWSTRRES